MVAWIVLLLVSALPTVILQEVLGQAVDPDRQALRSLGVVLIAALASLVWRTLCPLRPFLVLFAVLIGCQWLVYNGVDRLGPYPRWLGSPSFGVSMLAEQSLNLMVTLAVIATLLLLGKKRADFYLVKGNLDAPARPIRWMGVRQGDRWGRFGPWLTAGISVGTLGFLVIAGSPPADIAVRALPVLPVVLLAAALNAFNEEMTYKASFLSVLEGPIGPRQALYMVTVYFGVGHYYGIPYGVIGVLLAAFLGWILAKSMQETRGVFWAWFIHFVQDVWIFSFLAIGSITPGG